MIKNKKNKTTINMIKNKMAFLNTFEIVPNSLQLKQVDHVTGQNGPLHVQNALDYSSNFINSCSFNKEQKTKHCVSVD